MSLPTSSDAYQALMNDHPFIVELIAAFGFPAETFEGWTFWHRPESDSVWIVRADVRVVPGIPTGALGMLVSKNIAQPCRLAAGFIQRFGGAAIHGVLTLDIEATRRFTVGTRLPWPDGVAPRHHVIVVGTFAVGPEFSYTAPIGRGRFERGELCSDVPKALRFEVPESL